MTGNCKIPFTVQEINKNILKSETDIQVENTRVATLEKILKGEFYPLYSGYALNRRAKNSAMTIDVVLASFPGYNGNETQIIDYLETGINQEIYWRRILDLNIPPATSRVEKKQYQQYGCSPDSAFQNTKISLLIPRELPSSIIVFGKFKNGKDAVGIITPSGVLPSIALWDMYWTARQVLQELKAEKRN